MLREWRTRTWLRLKALLNREQLDRDLDDELQFHLAKREEKFAASGEGAQKTQSAARRPFGNPTSVREVTREMRTFASLATLWQDIRFGLRTLRKNPGFAVVAVLTLALGIGANAAIFSVINVLLIRTLPVSHPEDLVFLCWESPHDAATYLPYPLFDRLRPENETLAGMSGFHDLTLATQLDGKPGLAEGQLVSGNFFSLLGVRTIIGRAFTAVDDKVPGGAPYAVISFGYWQRQFGRNANVVGKPIVLNGRPFTVIGVTSSEFVGIETGASPDIWIPLAMQAEVMNGRSLLNNSASWWLQVMARRRPGIASQRALEEINVQYQRIARQDAGTQLSSERKAELAQEKISFLPASRGVSDLRDRFSEPLVILMALVGVLLLIACANVASLSLARATARQKEMAVRAALGAGRMRLIRQLLTESLLLAVLGGAAGLLLAYWGGDLLIALMAGNGTRLAISFHPDWRVYAFTAAVVILTGIFFGTASTWRAGRPDLNAVLQANSRALSTGGGAMGRSPWGMRRLLIVGEVAMSLFLLIGAGMLARTLQKLKDVAPGFNPNNVLLATVDPTLVGYQGPRLANLYKDLLDVVAKVPGVRAASLCAVAPMTPGQWRTAIFAQGHIPAPSENGTAVWNAIAPNYFQTLGANLLQGRDFTLRDDANAPLVAIINQAMARFYFGSDSPIGKRLSFRGPNGGEIEVVGLVQDMKYSNLRDPAPRVVFLPFLQTPQASLPFRMTLQISTAGNPQSYADFIRDALHKVASDLPILGISTLDDRINRSLGQERLVAQLSGLFGLVALILACIGLYGVMSYMVARRTAEIGLRVALGAQPGNILRMVLDEALRLVVAGIICGLPAAIAFSRVISNQLYGLGSFDAPAVGTATGALLIVATIASYLPARRAMRLDPMVALRHD